MGETRDNQKMAANLNNYPIIATVTGKRFHWMRFWKMSDLELAALD